MSVLLAVDGDSFAHRAYTACRSRPAERDRRLHEHATRLWEAERPASVLVGWDTLEIPTYRHESYEPYQSGRVFEDRCSSSSR